MTASQAAFTLRQRLGQTRELFAQLLGVSPKMIQRIEGGQQPAGRVLRILASIAFQNPGLETLARPFEDALRRQMKARVKDVRDTKRIRRVALSDLKYWSGYLLQTAQTIERVSPHTTREYLLELLRNAAWVMHHVRDEIEIPIDEPYTLTRMQEEQAILKDHWQVKKDKAKKRT